ncbi:hypothetical protein BIV57_08680 [Mangrovactinospora gilvigrisea]|uniref:AB hydrolase-1 domain-containing protein n=1 Tax=Mangrovactinospora gilvigrisea TaxID=1428644 RepID=A0A1J7BGY4_9ACTN|nr:alpha/beta fold hydrolase [Mangrovactinospora gilvigrisea]OIV37918.1 hypothetical protein BIV57_08680 [Mangrovactinospora gilvigrisea]
MPNVPTAEPRSAPAETPAPAAAPVRHVRAAVIGTGFAGLAAGHRLAEAGIHDFLLLERADDVGGTWRDNTYPGCACDVPSHLYAFSFAPNPRWPESFSTQPEIQQYLRECTDRLGLRDRIRFRTEARSADWDAVAGHWRLTTGNPELPALTADFLISACGPLSDPALPDIPGLDTFPGPVFHSSRWDHDFDPAGRRVAVVGTGASAIQIVPGIQPKAERLTLFQRTPAWIMPRLNHSIGGARQRLYNALPAARLATRLGIWTAREAYVPAFTRNPRMMRAGERLALAHLHHHIKDPGLRAKLTPDYTLGCKRVLLSDDFYPAIAADNAELVASGLAKVDGGRLIASDGTVHEADALIFATGFHATEPPAAAGTTGLDGRTLSEVWREQGMRALRGTAVAGFPNMFLLIGPNTGLGHSSMVQIIESQLNLVMDAVRRSEALGGAPLHPRADAQDRWNRGLQRSMERTVWSTGGCRSWYQDSTGRNTTLWPRSTVAFRLATRRARAAEFRPEPTGRPEVRQVASTDGVRLHVEVHADACPPDAPTVLLVHGWCCSTLFWRHVVRRLRRDYRVVAYDLRGHGRSSRPEDRRTGYSTRALADDLEAVVLATVPDGQRAVLAGHSMGSMTLLAAADRPAVRERTAAALLTSTGAHRLLKESTVLPAFLGRARARATDLVLGARAPMGPVTGLGSRVLAWGILGRDAGSAAAEMSARVVHACPTDVRVAWSKVLATLDLRDGAGKLDVPTRVLVGTDDRLTPQIHARRLEAALPDCTGLTVLPGAGHMTPIERPDEVAGAIRELAGQVGLVGPTGGAE